MASHASLLLRSAVTGDADGLREALGMKVDPNMVDGSKMGKRESPLFQAVRGGHERCCRILIEAKARVNFKRSDKRTALMEGACSSSSSNEIILRMLLDNGAAVDSMDRCGWTALSFAAFEDNVLACQTLIDAKANISGLDGGYPLHIAARYGSTSCLSTLLSSKADANSLDRRKQTPLTRAIENQHKAAADLLSSHGATSYLSFDKSGSIVDRRHSKGEKAEPTRPEDVAFVLEASLALNSLVFVCTEPQLARTETDSQDQQKQQQIVLLTPQNGFQRLLLYQMLSEAKFRHLSSERLPRANPRDPPVIRVRRRVGTTCTTTPLSSDSKQTQLLHHSEEERTHSATAVSTADDAGEAITATTQASQGGGRKLPRFAVAIHRFKTAANLATILSSACVFRADFVAVVGRKAALALDREPCLRGLRTSRCGLRFRYYRDIEACVFALRSEGFATVGVEIEAGAKAVGSAPAPFAGNTLFLVGHEGDGMSELELELCRKKKKKKKHENKSSSSNPTREVEELSGGGFVCVAQFGYGVPCLNVGTAASIVMHEFAVWAGYGETGKQVA